VQRLEPLDVRRRDPDLGGRRRAGARAAASVAARAAAARAAGTVRLRVWAVMVMGPPRPRRRAPLEAPASGEKLVEGPRRGKGRSPPGSFGQRPLLRTSPTRYDPRPPTTGGPGRRRPLIASQRILR
jgi:hypothetical protein